MRLHVLPSLLPLLGLLLAPLAGAAPGVPDSAEDRARLRQELARYARPENAFGFQARGEAAKRGLAHILEGRSLPLTVPLSAYRLLNGRQDPVDQWLAEGSVPSPFYQDRKVVLAHGDVVHEGLKGITLVTKTCITCHAGPVAGRLVAGVGNAQLDKVPGTSLAASLEGFDPFRWLDSREPEASIGQTMNMKEAGVIRTYVRYLRDYKAYADQVLVPSYSYATQRGDNTGPLGAWFMMARLATPEQTGLIQSEPGAPANAAAEALLATEPLPSVDPNPWWNIKFKARAYRFWDAPGHDPNDFNFNFFIPQAHIDDPATLEAHVEKIRLRAAQTADALAFARETEPPPLPAAAQADLLERWDEVEAGERIFHGGETASGRRQSCFRCHGTYRTDGDALVVDYPNRGLQFVGTDPAYNRLLQHLAPLTEKLNRTVGLYGEEVAPHSYAITEPGYAAPVLVGAWASAPYFHNGSVPTLAAVLERPSVRPKVWGRDLRSPDAYDLEDVGLAHEELDPAEAAAVQAAAAGKAPRSPEAIAARRLYDTRGFGRSNAGHPYGTRLEPAEKRALVAFLTSLAPLPDRPHVVPAGGRP